MHCDVGSMKSNVTGDEAHIDAAVELVDHPEHEEPSREVALSSQRQHQ
jgi:hypothetical protein